MPGDPKLGIMPGETAGMPDRQVTTPDAGSGFRGRRDRLGLMAEFANRVLDHFARPRQSRTLAQKQRAGLLKRPTRSLTGGRR